MLRCPSPTPEVASGKSGGGGGSGVVEAVLQGKRVVIKN